MKILLLTTHLRMGGVGIYVVTLARALKAKGHKVFVSSSGGELTKRLKEEQIPHFTIPLNTKSELSPKLLISLYRLFWFVLEEEIELIHAHTRVSQVVGEVLSFITRVSHVTTCHGFFKARLGRRLFGCWGKRVVAISEAVREHLVNDLKVKKAEIVLVHNGIDPDAFNKHYSPDELEAIKENIGLKPGPVVGIIARLSSVKGHRYLIEAMKRLVIKRDDIQLLIVGEGPEEEFLKKLVAKFGLKESVFFMDSILDTTLVLAVMDVFVLPSVAEGLGLALLEALAYRKPVVAFDAGGIYSVIKDGITGFLVPPRSVEKLTDAVYTLLEDKELSRKFGENGRKLVEKSFSLGDMADKIEGVYKEVLT